MDGIGPAIVGCGTFGRIRAQLTREHPAVTWLGLYDIDEDPGQRLAADTKTDFVTPEFNELLAEPA